jgi:hypothetical protein
MTAAAANNPGPRNGRGKPGLRVTKAVVEQLTNYALPSDAPVWERRLKALSLRNEGRTFSQIADVLYGDLPPEAGEVRAERDVRAAERELVRIPTDARLNRQHGIVLEMIAAYKPRALDGDKDAAGILLSYLQHAAKLDGLYAPARIQVGITETEFAGQAHELLSGAGGPAVLRALAELARVPAAIPPASSAPQQPAVVDGEIVPKIEASNEPEPWSNL